MSELASLEKSLRELLSKLDSTTFPIILGGGYGLYLRRTILERAGTRTLLKHWPEARSTNDLDLFLRPELLCDSTRLCQAESLLPLRPSVTNYSSSPPARQLGTAIGPTKGRGQAPLLGS